MEHLEAQFLTTCDFALTSKEGKLSLIGMFDRIFVSQVPSRYSRLFVVAIVTGEPNSSHQLTLELLTPSAEPLLPPRQVDISFATNGKANIITDVVNLPLPEIGEYTLRLKAGDQILIRESLYITKVEQPNQLVE